MKLSQKIASGVSVLALGGLAGFLLSQEPKTGGVAGTVVLKREQTRLGGAEVTLYPSGDEGSDESFTARTDVHGKFIFRNVPIGTYQLSASGEHHRSQDRPIEVHEASVSRAEIELTRSQPDLNVAEARQPVFTTRETPFLPVQGFAQPGDTLKITLWQTKLSKTLKQTGASEALQRMTSTFEGALPQFPAPLQATSPERIGSTKITVGRTDREGFFVQRLKLPMKNKTHGLYLVQVEQGPKSVCSWALVTDTALILKTAPDGTGLAYVTDLTSGQPVAGAQVGAQKTDADGLVRLSQSTGRLLATRGDDEATLSIPAARTENRGALVIHAWTDRTIYRPGHTASWKAMLRTRTNQALAVPAPIPAVVTVLDARGGEVQKETLTTSGSGALSGSFSISPEAETGEFTLKIEAGGETATKDITVAAYRKPEFETEATPAKSAYLRGETAEFSVAAKYYFGAPVAGASVTWQIFREGDWAAQLFEPSLASDLDDTEIESLQGGYLGEQVAEGKGVLDSSGRLSVRVPVSSKEGAAAVERFTLTATITDPSKRTSQAETSVRVASGNLILSVQPEGYIATPGKPTQVLVQATDLNGVVQAGVAVELQPAQVRWDQKTEKRTETRLGPVLRGTTGPDGRAALPLTPTKSGELRLTASSGSVQGVGSIYVLSETESEESYAGASRAVTLLTDKRSYKPGDTASVLVSAARPGQSVLVTVEGDALHETQLLRLSGRTGKLTLQVRPEWGPNVTLAACSVREKSLEQSQVPLRVSMPTRELSVKITPEKPGYGPGQKARFTVQLTDGDGKPAPGELSFSLVDEAIYALKPDDPKDLKKAFYPRRFNAVETRASFEVTYLSGESKSGPKIAPRRKFLDTALWLPAVKTDASGKAVVEARLPDNLTAWRATARAVTSETAVGYGVAKITTTKPFFVRLETPRFLVSGDATRALALVHNDTGQSQSVTVELSGQRQSLNVASGAIGKATFPLSSGGPLLLKAWTDGEKFTDAMEVSLPSRPFGRELTVSKAGIGDSTFTLDTDPRAIPDSLGLELSVAPGVRESLDDALKYLSEYPYGCVEQTTSRFLPALVLGRTDEKRVRDGLTRLRKLQHSSGGWGWWENGEDDPWMTGYALLAEIEASKRGYAAQTKESGLRGIEAARKLLAPNPNNGGPSPPLPGVGGQDSRGAGAGRGLLALALARAGEGGSVVSVLRKLDPKKLTDTELALWTLAAVEAKKDPGAIWPELQRRAVVSGALLSWRAGEREPESSDRMATALGLRALLKMNPTDPRADRAMRWLLTSRTGDGFGSTRDTAFVLLALSECALPANVVSTPPTASVNGVSVALKLQPGGGFRARALASALKPGSNRVELAHAEFWRVQLSQVVGKDATKGEISPVVPEGVIVERDFLKESDERPTTRFAQGEGVRVRLTLTVPKELEYVLIEDAFPAGFEPTERGTAETESSGSWEFWYDNIDVRDDRIAVFARRLKPGKHVFTYHLRAQTPGSFGVLPATLAPMYVEDFVAASRGATVEVRE